MAFRGNLATYLRKCKCIYTVRRFRYADDEVVSVNYQGAFRRTLVKEVKQASDLVDYATASGFDSTDSWWRAILVLNSHGYDALYLYKVEEVLVG